MRTANRIDRPFERPQRPSAETTLRNLLAVILSSCNHPASWGVDVDRHSRPLGASASRPACCCAQQRSTRIVTRLFEQSHEHNRRSRTALPRHSNKNHHKNFAKLHIMSAAGGTCRSTPKGRGQVPFASNTPSGIPRPALDSYPSQSASEAGASTLSASRAKQSKRDEVSMEQNTTQVA